MNTNKSFYVEIATGPVLFGVNEIWPNGDAPQNPTTSDVISVINSEPGGLTSVIPGWNLDLKLKVEEGPTPTLAAVLYCRHGYALGAYSLTDRTIEEAYDFLQPNPTDRIEVVATSEETTFNEGIHTCG